jgi:hypothetical protein
MTQIFALRQRACNTMTWEEYPALGDAGGTRNANEIPTAGNQASRHGLAPGTILVREWEGRPQRVMVLEDGFAWNGTTYRSLTEIAFVMTGTRWSGPRFFGIRSRAEKLA